MIPDLPYTTNRFDTRDKLLVRKAVRACLRKIECIRDSRARLCRPPVCKLGLQDRRAVRTAGQNEQGQRRVSGPFGCKEACKRRHLVPCSCTRVTVFVSRQAACREDCPCELYTYVMPSTQCAYKARLTTSDSYRHGQEACAGSQHKLVFFYGRRDLLVASVVCWSRILSQLFVKHWPPMRGVIGSSGGHNALLLVTHLCSTMQGAVADLDLLSIAALVLRERS